MIVNDAHIQLLGRYLSNNATPPEREQVDNWINQSLENRIVYEEFKQVWEHTSGKFPFREIDVTSAWNKLNARIEEVEVQQAIAPKAARLKIRSFKTVMYTLARVAAVVVVALGIYFMMDQQAAAPDLLSYTAQQVQQEAFVLPDGSQVYLKASASIEYPEQFASDERLVNFQGEAFFDIAHNPDQAFIIAVDNLRIKVLGTSFNLCTCPDMDEAVLYLESGKVLFYSVNPTDESIMEQIILTPGQKGIYNKVTGSISKEDFVGQNYKAWKSGALEFVRAPLSEVFATLENTYNIKIVSNRSFDDLYLTARYYQETPEQIFESLHLIFGLDYTISGELVTVD